MVTGYGRTRADTLVFVEMSALRGGSVAQPPGGPPSSDDGDGEGGSGRPRDPVLERAERDAFLLLFHLHNLSDGEPSRAFPLQKMSRDLAFGETRTGQLAQFLSHGHLLSDDTSALSITDAGVDYLRRAGRRRSARLGHAFFRQ